MPSIPTLDLNHILDQTRPLWSTHSNQRLFLTGGTGFFGLWFIESFLHANDRLNLKSRLTLLTRDPAAFARKSPHLASHPAITIHQGDIRTFTFPKGEFSHIIHAATPASATLDAVHPDEMRGIIVEGTRHVLDFALEARCQRFLFTSSGAVYGVQPPSLLRIPESHPLPTTMPPSAYAQGKIQAEALCALHSQTHSTVCLIARCFAFVGPHLPLDQHFAVGNFLRDALAGQPIRIQGDGSPVRSYLYASDLMIWLWTILFHGKSRRPYNVGSPHPLSIRELANLVAALPTPPVPVHIAQSPNPSVRPSRYVPNVTRAEAELKLHVHIPIQFALKRTYDWHRTSVGS